MNPREFKKFHKDFHDSFDVDPDYIEILKLHRLLEDAEIPHTTERFLDGWQVCYPSSCGDRVLSAIEHLGSYGRERDLIEIMGLLTPEEEVCDQVAGYLTAENVFRRIKRHYEGEWKHE